MSLFDFPRINLKGTLQLNPGTANNDDYAQQARLPSSYGAFAGQPLALIDSKNVRVRTYGMTDEAFISWVQAAHSFDIAGKPGQTAPIIPAEWNYYGGMDSKMIEAKVIGVQTTPDQVYSSATSGVPLTAIIGASLELSGSITDVNSEGSPPATQFFIEKLALTNGAETLLSGKASKAAGQWLNFYRNVNLAGDAGAGSYVYHVLWKKDMRGPMRLPGFDHPKIAGVIFRYYLYRRGGGASTNEAITALYENQSSNPATVEIVGTLAPLFEGESIVAAPTGRLLVSNQARIPTPPGSTNNGNGFIALAPAVLRQSDNLLSADFVGSFPDYFQPASGTNPKYDFKEVSLIVSSAGRTAVIGPVDYADTAAGDRRGWIFDFDVSCNPDARRVLQDPDAKFSLQHPSLGIVLEEVDYYFVSNQQAIYAEQFGPGDSFINQGTSEAATVSVFYRGRELSGDTCPPITVWQYRSIPLQSPGEAEVIDRAFKPGQALKVDTSQPGNFLFTFTAESPSGANPGGNPPQQYSTFMSPPFVTNSPSISLRILPNDEDLSQYYVDPGCADPVGNELLTFAVVYEKVLRTYYLLYPAMKQVFPLNNEEVVAQNADGILAATQPSFWMSIHYMPRTRDLSASRARLLQAWCRKVRQAPRGA